MGVAHGPLELGAFPVLWVGQLRCELGGCPPRKASACRPTSTACTGLIPPPPFLPVCCPMNYLRLNLSLNWLLEEPKTRHQVSSLETCTRLWLS